MSTKVGAPSERTASDGLTAARNGSSCSGTGGAVRVGEIQRARLVAAMVDVAAERGVANVTVAHVVERAGVSRRTFYEIFGDCEECLLAALDDALRGVSEHVLAAYREDGRWSDRVRAGLVALLEFLEADPVTGHLLIVGSLGAGARALERRRVVLAGIVAVVDEGRGESKTGREPTPLVAEGAVGGVLSILHARLPAVPPQPAVARDPATGVPPPPRENESLLALTGPLMSMIVLPYLGPAAARRELQRPVPERRAQGPRPGGDPLRDIGLRLTYRTVRALSAIAERPGSSNREIGQAAGIADQAQISKLLSRLERLELAHNTGLGPGTGAPNMWTLTQRGQAIHRSIVSA